MSYAPHGDADEEGDEEEEEDFEESLFGMQAMQEEDTAQRPPSRKGAEADQERVQRLTAAMDASRRSAVFVLIVPLAFWAARWATRGQGANLGGAGSAGMVEWACALPYTVKLLGGTVAMLSSAWFVRRAGLRCHPRPLCSSTPRCLPHPPTLLARLRVIRSKNCMCTGPLGPHVAHWLSCSLLECRSRDRLLLPPRTSGLSFPWHAWQLFSLALFFPIVFTVRPPHAWGSDT